jgi:hypothetical protein
MDISKIGIGVVVTVVLQTGGIVWWVAQQSFTIDALKAEVAKVTDSVKLERQINLERDVIDLKRNVDIMQQRLDTHWTEINASATIAQIDDLQQQINNLLNVINSLR